MCASGTSQSQFRALAPEDGLEAPGAPSGIGQAKPLHACQASRILRAISHSHGSILLALQMFALQEEIMAMLITRKAAPGQ